MSVPPPTRATLGDGTQVAVVLLDTEGVGGLEADRRYDERIFALATLLSATLVYNSLGSIDENAIGQLSFVAQLSRHVRFAPKDEAVGDEGDEAEEDARRWRGGVRSTSGFTRVASASTPPARRRRLDGVVPSRRRHRRDRAL